MKRTYLFLALSLISACLAATVYADGEKDADKPYGFDQAWADPQSNFSDYEVIYVDAVDASALQLADDAKKNLSNQMRKRFVQILGTLMPTVKDQKEIAGRKALSVKLKLTGAAKTNVVQNVAVDLLNPLPVDVLGLGSEGELAFEGAVTDLSTGKNIVTVQDKTDEDKNSSLVGVEDFGPWQHAYDIMESWADSLAILLAEKRGQKYKSVCGYSIL